VESFHILTTILELHKELKHNVLHAVAKLFLEVVMEVAVGRFLYAFQNKLST